MRHAWLSCCRAAPLFPLLALQDLQDADQAAGVNHQLGQLVSVLPRAAGQRSTACARGFCCCPVQRCMAPPLHALAIQQAGLHRVAVHGDASMAQRLEAGQQAT